MQKVADSLENDELDTYMDMANRLLAKHDAERVVATALKLLTRESSDIRVELTPERPLRTKKVKMGDSPKYKQRRDGDRDRRDGFGGSRPRGKDTRGGEHRGGEFRGEKRSFNRQPRE
ncbi:hypothetical protein MXD63_41040, partial [Frankia sp. Cpl3]|nr:hypothetical protein [Frankia sp. Cpl3]